MRWSRFLPLFSILFPILYEPTMYHNWPVATSTVSRPSRSTMRPSRLPESGHNLVADTGGIRPFIRADLNGEAMPREADEVDGSHSRHLD